MTDQELRDLIAGNAIAIAEMRVAQQESREEADRQMRELRASQQETDRQIRELRASQQETDRQLRESRKQIGELGNKFGSFTEGMALPSMDTLFTTKFGMKEVTPRRRRQMEGRTMEIDALAIGEPDEPTAYIIEVKSHLKEDHIPKLLQKIEEFPKFFDEHAHRKVYGVLVGVDTSDAARNVAFQNGIYLARISDDVFTLETPPNFKPRAFGPHTNGTANGSRKRTGKKGKKK